ncbi:hypothetical protein ATX60_09540 [Oenococcus oeni]|uniref:hypothetical protein n=1 Tax=Oenococcus oeni TaxID=1247 RepID=UPI0008F80C4F|nr:hypothetical protein [Oenococcus oeni]OIM22410.1 hypothetical protein ATX60_09540 [Oenococcus oeni]
MRLKERDLKTVYLRELIHGQDEEGHDLKPSWGEAIELQMNIQSAGGSVNAQIWGKELKYIKFCRYQGDLIREGVNENWGICLYVTSNSDPDYLIDSIQTFSTHKNITLEKRDKGVGTNG